MFIVVDRSVNYCLFFGGIATIEVIFVWFCFREKSHHATSLSHTATLSGDKVARQSCVTKSDKIAVLNF